MLVWLTWWWSYYWGKVCADLIIFPWGQDRASEEGKLDRIGWEALGFLLGDKVFHTNVTAGSPHWEAVPCQALFRESSLLTPNRHFFWTLMLMLMSIHPTHMCAHVYTWSLNQLRILPSFLHYKSSFLPCALGRICLPWRPQLLSVVWKGSNSFPLPPRNKIVNIPFKLLKYLCREVASHSNCPYSTHSLL